MVWDQAPHWDWGLGYKDGSVPFHASDSLCCFDVPRNTTVLNSKVISVTVKPPPRSLLTPLEIEFAHMYNVSVAHVHGDTGTFIGSECAPTHPSRAQLKCFPSKFQVGKLSLRVRDSPRATQWVHVDSKIQPLSDLPPDSIPLQTLIPWPRILRSCVTGHLPQTKSPDSLPSPHCWEHVRVTFCQSQG